MVRSSSAEPTKTTKRYEGTRSVSTLTPSQLARKRANDREAQRATRTRTKELIGQLERELEELKNKQSREQTVQELLHRNKALEVELNRLKKSMGISMASSPYSTPVYDDNLSSGRGTIPSPRTWSFLSGDYNPLLDISQQCVSPPNSCQSWARTFPCPVPSNVSNPSLCANTDDYNAGYIPTSVPTSMLPSNNTNTNVNALSHKDIKLEYEDAESHETGFRLSNPPMPALHPSFYMQQQPPWNMYPVYYPPAESLVR